MDEFDRIGQIVLAMPRCREQLNGVFESDAEIVTMGNRRLAITIDEFSAEEDGFPAGDPELLGWNLAIATISDLLAVGADPAWFLQVVSVPDTRPESFCSDLMRGVGAALEVSGAHLIGGDLSRAPDWRYVGNAVGFCESEPILRKSGAGILHLYATGPMGIGNLAFVNPGYRLKLSSRREFMVRLREYISLAMDSSDGLRNTLLTLLRVNPGHTITAVADGAVIHPDVLEFCVQSHFPPEGFLFASAGEYELILGVEPARKDRFEQAAGNAVIPIGTMSATRDRPGTLLWQHSRLASPEPDIPLSIDPRGTSDLSGYIGENLRVVKRLFYR